MDYTNAALVAVINNNLEIQKEYLVSLKKEEEALSKVNELLRAIMQKENINPDVVISQLVNSFNYQNSNVAISSLKVVSFVFSESIHQFTEAFYSHIGDMLKNFFSLCTLFHKEEKILADIIDAIKIISTNDNIDIGNTNYYNCIAVSLWCAVCGETEETQKQVKSTINRIINSLLSKKNRRNVNNKYEFFFSKFVEDDYLSKKVKLMVDSIVDAPTNEKGIEKGKYGWCFSCRNPSNFISKKFGLPICSHDCELDIQLLFADTDILIFYEDDDSHRVNLIFIFGYVMNRYEEVCNICCENIIKLLNQIKEVDEHLILVIKETVFPIEIFDEEKMKLFLVIISNEKLRAHLRKEIYEIFSENIFKRLSSISVIEDILSFNQTIYFDIFFNYDCELGVMNIYTHLIEVVTKLIYTLKEGDELKEKCLELIRKTLTILSTADEEKEINSSFEKYKAILEYKSKVASAVTKFNLNPASISTYLITSKIVLDQTAFMKLKDSSNEQVTVSHASSFFSSFYENRNEVIIYDDYLAFELGIFFHDNLNLIDKKNLNNFISQLTPFNVKVLFYFINAFDFKTFHLVEAVHLVIEHITFQTDDFFERFIKIFGEKYAKDNEEMLAPEKVSKLAKMSLELNNDILAKNSIKPMSHYIDSLASSNISLSFICDVYNKSISWENMIFPEERVHIDEMKKDSPSSFLPGLMLFSTWTNYFGIFTKMLNDSEKEETINLCVENLIQVAKIASKAKLTSISETVINTICNLTHVLDNTIISKKSFICAHKLIEFATSEGNVINSSWMMILRIISRIDYFQTGVFDTETTDKKFIEIEKNIFDTNSNIFRKIQYDEVFQNTSKFSVESFQEFLTALCCVSKKEVEEYKNSQNTFSLHKLIECCEYNQERKEEEWEKLYGIVSEFFLGVINKNIHNEKIVSICIDALRQLISKLIFRNFEKEFMGVILSPFKVIVMKHSNNELVKNLVTDCLGSLIGTRNQVKLPKHAWKTIFEIISVLLINKKATKGKLGDIMKSVPLDDLLDENNLKSYIECISLIYNTFSQARTMLSGIIDYIHKIEEVDKRQNLMCILLEATDEIIPINYYTHLALINDFFSALTKDSKKEEFIDAFRYIYTSYIKNHLIALLDELPSEVPKISNKQSLFSHLSSKEQTDYLKKFTSFYINFLSEKEEFELYYDFINVMLHYSLDTNSILGIYDIIIGTMKIKDFDYCTISSEIISLLDIAANTNISNDKIVRFAEFLSKVVYKIPNDDMIEKLNKINENIISAHKLESFYIFAKIKHDIIMKKEKVTAGPSSLSIIEKLAEIKENNIEIITGFFYEIESISKCLNSLSKDDLKKLFVILLNIVINSEEANLRHAAKKVIEIFMEEGLCRIVEYKVDK